MNIISNIKKTFPALKNISPVYRRYNKFNLYNLYYVC